MTWVGSAVFAPVDEARLRLEQATDELEAHVVDDLRGHHRHQHLIEEGRGDHHDEGDGNHQHGQRPQADFTGGGKESDRHALKMLRPVHQTRRRRVKAGGGQAVEEVS